MLGGCRAPCENLRCKSTLGETSHAALGSWIHVSGVLAQHCAEWATSLPWLEIRLSEMQLPETESRQSHIRQSHIIFMTSCSRCVDYHAAKLYSALDGKRDGHHLWGNMAICKSDVLCTWAGTSQQYYNIWVYLSCTRVKREGNRFGMEGFTQRQLVHAKSVHIPGRVSGISIVKDTQAKKLSNSSKWGV